VLPDKIQGVSARDTINNGFKLLVAKCITTIDSQAVGCLRALLDLVVKAQHEVAGGFIYSQRIAWSNVVNKLPQTEVTHKEKGKKPVVSKALKPILSIGSSVWLSKLEKHCISDVVNQYTFTATDMKARWDALDSREQHFGFESRVKELLNRYLECSVFHSNALSRSGHRKQVIMAALADNSDYKAIHKKDASDWAAAEFFYKHKMWNKVPDAEVFRFHPTYPLTGIGGRIVNTVDALRESKKFDVIKVVIDTAHVSEASMKCALSGQLPDGTVL